MGTKTGLKLKESRLSVRFLFNEGGPLAQLLHPCWIARNDLSLIADVLRADALLTVDAPQVNLVLAGGGLIELSLSQERPRRRTSSTTSTPCSTRLPTANNTPSSCAATFRVSRSRRIGRCSPLWRPWASAWWPCTC